MKELDVFMGDPPPDAPPDAAPLSKGSFLVPPTVKSPPCGRLSPLRFWGGALRDCWMGELLDDRKLVT